MYLLNLKNIHEKTPFFRLSSGYNPLKAVIPELYLSACAGVKQTSKKNSINLLLLSISETKLRFFKSVLEDSFTEIFGTSHK